MLPWQKRHSALEVVSIKRKQQGFQYESAHQMTPLVKLPLINKRCLPQLVAAMVAVLAGASDAPLGKNATPQGGLVPGAHYFFHPRVTVLEAYLMWHYRSTFWTGHVAKQLEWVPARMSGLRIKEILCPRHGSRGHPAKPFWPWTQMILLWR